MSAIVFIPLVALTWVLGLALAMLAAHYFLVIIDSTAAGSDEIVWPRDNIIDWFWKLCYLIWLAGAWAAPLVVASRVATYDPYWRFVIFAASVWLLFPMGMLSSLSSASIWNPYSRRVWGRLKQRPGAVLSFYVLSVPIVVGLVFALNALMVSVEGAPGRCLFLALIGALCYLLYARVLGRLGLILTFTKGAPNEPGTRRRKKKKAKQAAPSNGQVESPAFVQPSELPPIETPYEGPVTGYDVTFGDQPAPVLAELPKPMRNLAEDEDLTPLSVEAPPEVVPETRPPLPPVPESEMALWDTSKRVKEPKRIWGITLVSFLGEGPCTTALIVLASGLTILGLLIRLMHELRPA